MTTDIRMPASREPEFAALIKKINKRAKRLGLDPISTSVTGRETEQKVIGYRSPRLDEAALMGGEQAGRVAVYADVEFVTYHIDGDAPVLEGDWRLQAVLTNEGIVRPVPGSGDVPVSFRDRAGDCDHCNKRRHRSETFIVKNADGDFAMVGRNCLVDFLGALKYNPKTLASYFEFMLDSLGGFGDEWDADRDYCGQRGVQTINVEEVVNITAAILQRKGWVSKSASEAKGLPPTSYYTSMIIWPPRPVKGQLPKEYHEAREILDECRETGIEIGERALEWAREQNETGDYMTNLRTVANLEETEARNFGLVVSLAAMYLKHTERLEEAASKKSEWVGTVKKREEFTLTLVKVRFLESFYGTTTLCCFEDDERRQYKWFASDPWWIYTGREGAYTDGGELKIGTTFVMKATVKKHDEYNGMKQTVLTRCAALKEVA
jgi:hypothetical protein